MAFALTVTAFCTYAFGLSVVLYALTAPKLDAIALAIGVFLLCLTAYLAVKADCAFGD